MVSTVAQYGMSPVWLLSLLRYHGCMYGEHSCTVRDVTSLAAKFAALSWMHI